jgi:hypothetical protein
MRFLSTLSWVEERGFMVELSGGNLPRPMGRDKERGFSICDEFDLSYFPEVTNERAMLALGPDRVSGIALRRTVWLNCENRPDDYEVRHDGRTVGRIYRFLLMTPKAGTCGCL